MEGEFKSAQEEGLYGTLKHVLSNYIVHQRISYHQTLGAYLPFLGFQLASMILEREEIPALIAQTVTALHEDQQARTHRPLPSFADYARLDDAPSPQGEDLGNALVRLLQETAVEHDLSVAGTWRACVALFADVLAMARLDDGAEHWDMDAYIESVPRQLPPLVEYWYRRLHPTT